MTKNYKLIPFSIWCFLWICFVFVGHVANAQTKTVKGTVLSAEDKESIPGATILIKGTSKGTVSDMDGNFAIDLAGIEQPILVISFLGFKSQELIVGGQTSFQVNLEMDIEALDEVVVIGYGTQKKKVVTAATVSLTSKSIESRLSTNALQAMQGQAAGVSIRSNSGQPGDGFKINIRGLGTINNGGPLYIVDGMQTGDIKYLNNADIESIDVLKDAASAAIYGSRGANGVVLITTKKGKTGSSQLTFDAYYGLQNRPRSVDLLNAQQYAQIMNEQHLNSGGAVSALPFDTNNLPAYTSDGAANTDWMDRMFVKNAVTQNYSLGMTGGSEASTYSVSMSYTAQDGIVGGPAVSNYDRLGGRINSEHKLYNGFLKVGENLTITTVDKRGISVGNQYSNTLRSAFSTSPLMPVNNDAGEYFNSGDKTILNQFGKPYFNEGASNPYGSMLLNNQNNTNERKILGNVYAEIEPIKNLKIRTSLGIDFYSEEYRSFRPIYSLSLYDFNTTTDVVQRMKRSRTFQFDNYATYDISSGEHAFNIMIGTSSRNYQGSQLEGKNSTLVFNDFEHAWLDNATNKLNPELNATGKPDDEDKLLSYFSRIQYNFKEKYLFNATFRADGSSKFAKGNQWGYFPSLSAGWVISEERFLNQVSAISFAKLRASWGQNGSQAIDGFQYVGPIAFTNATYAFGNVEGVNTPGSYQKRLGNPKVKWETSEQIDIGADMKFMSNKLSVNLDWYKKTTIDWLITAPLPGTAGADAPAINGGKVVNNGFEWELAYQDEIGDFEYSFGVNGAFNKNEVKEIPTVDGIVHGGGNTLYANSTEFYRAENGHPIGYFWGYETVGLFQTSADVNAYKNSEGKLIQPNAAPGDIKYVDRNGDGILNDSDKVQLGNPNPPLTFGLNFSANYHGFDFSVMCFGVAGNDIVQAYRDPGNKFGNYTTAILDRWTGAGTSNTVPRVTNANVNYNKFSSIFIQDGSYVRIGNITLGYDFAKIIKAKNVSQLRLYAAVNNLYTFTKYDGMDADVGYGLDNGSQDKFSSGIDLGFYPNPRTMLLGLSVKF